jgi:hypothetical protein
MAIEKKSLISSLQSTKKANVAKEHGASDVSKTAGVKSPVTRRLAAKSKATKAAPAKKMALKN